MPSVTEAADARTPLGASLAAGVNTLSNNQKVEFALYVKLVLPLDGYIFWVRADLVAATAILLAAQLASGAAASALPLALTVQCSLHYATDTAQREDETAGINSVIVTALAPVADFNAIDSNFLYIATLPDGVRYAFNGRRSYYQQAGLHHYYGTAVIPAFKSQIVDDLDGFDLASIVVSNSLPIWLGLNDYTPPYDDGIPAGRIRLYPSFAIPTNLEPVYGAVHIEPSSTSGIQAAPYLGPTLSHDQLVTERVRVTLYGTRNFSALDFLDYVLQYSVDYDVLGIMNIPIVRDEKRTQSELSVLAEKKIIDFEVNYLQSTVRTLARQLILHCVPTIIFE